MSSLLLEKNNRAGEAPETPQSFNHEFKVDSPPIIWFTPKKSTELKTQATRLQKLKEQRHFTQRLLFRKAIKEFKEQENVLADRELKIQALEAQLEKARSKKRRKVKTSLNSKFANIGTI